MKKSSRITERQYTIYNVNDSCPSLNQQYRNYWHDMHVLTNWFLIFFDRLNTVPCNILEAEV